jgi:biotin carboxylase
MGWPGTPVDAVLACQHKLYARQVLQRVCPQANIPFEPLAAHPGDPVSAGIRYPVFVKPVKAAFSVLARCVYDADELHRHTRFGLWESWVMRRLVEPFDQVLRRRLPQVPSAYGLLLESPVQAPQYCLDGYVFEGRMHTLGVVDAVMYPGTQAFMRFEYPSRLPASVAARASDIAQRFLQAVGFTHGLFNMEFFHDPATDRLSVIEFNPRMASQFSDLYRRVDGIDLHEMGFALAHGLDPALTTRSTPSAGVAASFVYRSFEPQRHRHAPSALQAAVFRQAYPDAMLLEFPKPPAEVARDFRWLGSHRYGIVHLGGTDAADLRRRCEVASSLLGWSAPYEDVHPHQPRGHGQPASVRPSLHAQ